MSRARCLSPRRTHTARKHIRPAQLRERLQQVPMVRRLWTKLLLRRRESLQCSKWAQTSGKNRNSIWQGMLECAEFSITTANLSCRQQAIYRPGGAAAKKPGPDPDQPLPSEYVCYRCGVKGEGYPVIQFTYGANRFQAIISVTVLPTTTRSSTASLVL